MNAITNTIAAQIGARNQQVDAAIELLDQGCTVPFIARYRKEVTGSLDDGQLRKLEQQLGYQRELISRRESIIERLKEQGKLSSELHKQLNEAASKSRLEEIYQPYKSSRKTKADMAAAAGLSPLLDQLIQQPSVDPHKKAQSFVKPETDYGDVDSVLDGIEAILQSRLTQMPQLLDSLRSLLWQQGQFQSRLAKGKEQEGQKFKDYFDHHEPLKKIPSHRLLAILRGQQQSILKTSLELPEPYQADDLIRNQLKLSRGTPLHPWMEQQLTRAWQRKLQPMLERELVGRARESAEKSAIDVFAQNLKQLLLASPAGHKTTLGLDPGLRTGVKVAVVDGTGKLLQTSTIYPHVPRNQWQQSLQQLHQLCKQHQVELISIGNGTGSKETDRLVAELLTLHPNLNCQKLMVSEAGASVYSASELAAKEFPDLDVSLRGAVSIARRLQDPLSELVKIEPKAIGVGQYQHDVNQGELATQLDGVVEDCVNSVGVDLNTASEALLQYVSGLTPTLARNIVARRDQEGPFNRRSQLQKVQRLGPKAFEQAAGFLRITDGDEPLDGSAVHPEAYKLVKKIATSNARSAKQLIGDSALLKSLRAGDYVDQQFGELTVKDILQELEKPGRDPRPSFKTASFRDDVNTLQDLQPGMKLQGVITNVTNFGAFVDIGVHQDGLVHISMLADRFVKDPHELVKAGDIVDVRVLEVDEKRRRIGLSMKSDEASAPQPRQSSKPESKRPNQNRQEGQPSRKNKGDQQQRSTKKGQENKQMGTMAALFNEALKKKN
ncbi:MAG: RNA-binding transcriptional accessory protein [Motiliproteus sp.]|nr:RNA-binding transcriptional accessory protein [Motiliproteus sp.]MCW9053610.1 RNA-binding transcriptional accessory protein [Motiliproteus sp.]